VSDPKQVGMSCENSRFVKKGLGPDEAKRVEADTKANQERWKYLLTLNVWKPVDAAR